MKVRAKTIRFIEKLARDYPSRIPDELCEEFEKLLELIDNTAIEQMQLRHYVVRAHELHHSDGELEVDDDAIVSIAEQPEGAYVQCWVWVPKEEVDGD